MPDTAPDSLLYGYCRVSSVDQNLARQEEQLKAAGVPIQHILADKASGKNTDREKLQTIRNLLPKGSTLFVPSMDRLARNLSDLLSIVKELSAKGVTVRFLKEGQTFDGSPHSKLILGIFGTVAEFERSLIRERQQEGINAAKARGAYTGGRPEKLTEAKKKELVELHGKGVKVVHLAKQYGISRPVVYRVLKEAQKA